MASTLNSAPASAFFPTEQSLFGFMHVMSKTQGDIQAQVLLAMMNRGPAMLRSLDVSRHLFLAQQVGRQGNAQGARWLRQCWWQAGLSENTQQGLVEWVGRYALLSRRDAVWEEVQAWPNQNDRPDRLLLAFQCASQPEEFAWGWRFQGTTPWQTCVETAWNVLQRAWPPRPVPWTIASPALAVEVVQRLLDPLPWAEAPVTQSLSSLFGLPKSPFRTLLENEFRPDPRVRMSALEACLPLVKEWEQRQVTLAYNSQLLERAHQRHAQRMNRQPAAVD